MISPNNYTDLYVYKQFFIGRLMFKKHEFDIFMFFHASAAAIKTINIK